MFRTDKTHKCDAIQFEKTKKSLKWWVGGKLQRNVRKQIVVCMSYIYKNENKIMNRKEKVQQCVKNSSYVREYEFVFD